MGNCVTKQFELLNEHNDRYFDQVQSRNSTTLPPKKKRWNVVLSPRKAHVEKWDEEEQYEGSEWPLPAPQVTTTVSTLSTTNSYVRPSFSSGRNSPNTSTIHQEVNLDESTFSLESPWKPLRASTSGIIPSPTTPTANGGNSPLSNSFPEASTTMDYQQAPRGTIMSGDVPAIDSWQVRRKGSALQMRLAKHRFLSQQVTMSSSNTMSPPATATMSPITLDSSHVPFAPAASANNNEWDTDFQANGMVWVEISRKVLVTALAMSRSRQTSSIVPSLLPLEASRPLLMAVGDEAGMVTVTEIIDEHRSPSLGTSSGDAGGDAENNKPMLRKFGETLEFPMEGRIRSMDFSPDDRYLLVGGDGCVVVILLVVLHPTTKELQDLRILQQVERVDRIYSVQFHSNGSHLSTAGYDGKVGIASVEDVLSPITADSSTFKEVSRTGLIYCLDWSPNFAVGGSDKICAIYNEAGKLVHERPRKSSIQTLKWNPDGKVLAVGDREVMIVDGRDFHVKCLISNAPDESSSPRHSNTASNNKYRIESLCWSPDGTFLAIAGSDGICLVVESKGYALVHEVHRSSSILCLSWGQRISGNEYGRYLAISDQDCSVALIKAGAEPEDSERDEASSAASSAYYSTGSDWVLKEEGYFRSESIL